MNIHEHPEYLNTFLNLLLFPRKSFVKHFLLFYTQLVISYTTHQFPDTC
jgi:hypothetical protein